MTREERALKLLEDSVAFADDGWVECTPERVVEIMLTFADDEAAAMRERAAAYLDARADEIRASATNSSVGAMMYAVFAAEAAAIRALSTRGEG